MTLAVSYIVTDQRLFLDDSYVIGRDRPDIYRHMTRIGDPYDDI